MKYILSFTLLLLGLGAGIMIGSSAQNKPLGRTDAYQEKTAAFSCPSDFKALKELDDQFIVIAAETFKSSRTLIQAAGNQDSQGLLQEAAHLNDLSVVFSTLSVKRHDLLDRANY